MSKWKIVLISIIILVLGVGGYFVWQKYFTKNSTPASSTTLSNSADLWLKSEQPWPMFHGNYNHSGYIDVTGPNANNLKWKYKVGGIQGNRPNSVAISKDKTIYVAGNSKIIALDESGKVKWEKEFTSPQGPALSEDNKTIYFVSNNSIVAIDNQGDKKWEFKTGGNTIFGPTIGPDGTIYQGSWDKYFYALNSDGSLKWKYQTEGAVSYPASIDKNGNIYLGGGDAHSGPDSNIYAFDNSGKLLWTYDTKALRVGSPAVGYDGLLYFPASPVLFVLNTQGKLVWKKGPNVNGPNQVSVNNSSISIAKAEELGPPPSGQPNNNQNPPANNPGQDNAPPPGAGSNEKKDDIAGIISPAITPDGVLYVGTSQGTIYSIDIKTQEIKWSYQTEKAPEVGGETGLPSFPMVDKDGTAYFGSHDYNFYAIDKDGKIKWSYKTEGKITEAAPAIDLDGTIYFTSEDGYLYAIGG